MDVATATLDVDEWELTLTIRPVYDRLQGPHRRLDLGMRPKVPDRALAVAPHGIVGQSFDGDALPRKGRVDVYPPLDRPGSFTTSAMAEGAIEGVAADYEVPLPFATAFAYERFARRGRSYCAKILDLQKNPFP